MAGTQQIQKKNSLFPPNIFDDPDALSQIAQVETPPAQPLPDQSVQNAAPLSGIVPSSFLDWHADPANVAKVKTPVTPGTPMPSMVAKAAETAMQPPPIDPAIEGAPQAPATLFGPPAATQAPALPSSPGLVKAQPSLEDALVDAPQSQPAQAAPSGPPSRQEFLGALPGGHAPIPSAPQAYQGKKLAAMGLFTALDSIGAALTHNQPTVGPGLMANAQALREYNRNLPATQTAADTTAYEERLKEGGLINAQTKIPVTVAGPNGQPITMMVDPATAKTLLPAQAKAGGTVQAAQIGAQSRMDVKQLELQIQQGQISKMVPGINPANNQPQYEAFNKAGKSLGFIDHSVVPGLIARTSSTVDYKEDGDGNLHALPKTTVSAPNLPGARQPLTPPAASPRPTAAPVPPVSGSGTPVAPLTPGSAAAPKPAQAASNIVPGFIGKAAKDNGYAYDSNNHLVYTSRSDANQSGLTQFQKVSEADVNKDKGALRMLNDVQANKSRYAQAAADYMKNGGDYEKDAAGITQIISDNPFSMGIIHLPAADILKKVENSRAYTGLTPAGKELVDGYYRAKAAVPAYQKALTNIGRANKEMMDLELNNIPDPILGVDDIQRKLGAFQENIDRATEGIPQFKDVKQPTDIRAQYEPSWVNQNKKNNQNVAPEGTIVQVGNGRQIKKGGQWVSLP